MSEEGSLRDLLKGDLKKKIEYVWEKAKEYHSSQRGDNIQGAEHCKTIEKILYRLIPDRKKDELKQIDLFLLSVAACLHDIGKIVEEKWEDHGQKSKQIILDEYESLGLDKGEAVAVADIVGVHTHGQLNELPKRTRAIGSIRVDIEELAAIFRLADMLDTSYQRAPEILSRIKFPGGNKSSKWRGRQSIIGWYLDEKNRIILQAEPRYDDLDAAYALFAMMKEELSKISPYLKLYGYPYELGKLDVGDIFLEPEIRKRAAQRRPFPGMAFYTSDDVSIFKGRDDEIESLLLMVSAFPITLLIGESGVGETSLIHAGLFPRLRLMSWECIWTRPLDNPIENIKNTIWNKLFMGEPDSKIGLLDVLKQTAEKFKPQKILIVMDQFEDILNCNDQSVLDDLSLIFMAVQTATVIPTIRVLISFREDSLVELSSRLLKKITGSAQQFPSVELERLTREGAKSAFLTGLESAGVGLDPLQEKGEKSFVDTILDDIQNGSRRLYPPYIQMVAETLCKTVDRSNLIITKEKYSELGGSNTIIARYLMERLNEFGSQKNNAEKVLISFISSAGEKIRKTLPELNKETEIDYAELSEIIEKMVDLRMIQYVSDDKFEIIHDYLGKSVYEELIREDNRAIKFLNEQLGAFYRNYMEQGAPVVSPPFLAKLYRNRRKIKIDEEVYPLIACFALMGKKGLGWYWLKDLDSKRLLEIIKDQISNEMEDIKNQAARILVRIIDSNEKNNIIEMMRYKDSKIRIAAVEALGKIAKPEDKDVVIEMLHDKDWQVWSTACRILMKMVSLEDKGKIIEMLHEKDPGVRIAAVEALGKIAEPEDKDKIIEMLHDEDFDVQSAAIEVLQEIAGPEDREIMIEILYDENSQIQSAAGEIFAKIAEPEDKERIIEMLHDEDTNVQWAAREALENLISRKNKDKIIEMLHDKDFEVRRVAVRVLGRMAGPEDKDVVIEMLHNRDWYIQTVAAKIFTEIVSSEDKEMIIEMLNDGDRHVRLAALEAFERIANPEDKDVVITMLHDNEKNIRLAALDELGKMVCHEDKDVVIGMLHDEDPEVRSEAVKVLEKIAGPEDREIIIEILYDENSQIQSAAGEIFAKIAEPEDKERIIEMLNDGDWHVRLAALEAFERIANPEDKDVVIEMLHDEWCYVRETASEIFVKIAIQEDKEKITEMLHDEYCYVRLAALEAFERIANPEDKDVVIGMLHDEDPEVRSGAILVLARIADPEVREHILDLLSDEAQGYKEKQMYLYRILSLLDRVYYCPFSWISEDYEITEYVYQELIVENS
jgi:HEAT repeat protein